MTRFPYLENANHENRRNFRRKLRQSLPRFLAYCAIMRACRSVPQFRMYKPVVVGLILPEGADMDLYEDAVAYAAMGPSVLYGVRDDTLILTMSADSKKRGRDADFMTALGKQRRVVVLAHSQDSMPENFALFADGIVQIEPLKARHVIAGAKLCLHLAVTPEQAEFISKVPLSMIVATLRRGRPVPVAIELMKKAIAAKATKDVAGPTLDDLHGLGEAGDWGRELAVDFTDWRSGKIDWQEVDRGVLLSGPPGTGKTTFAAALARSCNAHLVLGSLARWQAKGHLGDLLKAMRAAFDEARKNTPSIIFVDEIDAFGDRERFDDHNRQYSIEVVSALLECIDGTEGREGVVVVGACNFPDRLDPALVRAGRLDRHIQIPLPDPGAREGILRWHLQGQLADADLSSIVARTDDWNGASLEQLVRQGRRRARRERRELVLDDLAAGLPLLVPVPPEMRRRAAIHEAGHAVVALELRHGVLVSVSVESAIPHAPNLLQKGGGVRMQDHGITERTHAQLLDGIVVRLAGVVAEEVVLGGRSAGGGGRRGSDLHTATLLALAIEASYGLGEGLAYLASEDEDELVGLLRFDRFLHARVEKVLKAQNARAKRLVEDHRTDIERIAQVLLDKGALSAEEVRDLLSQQPRLRLIEEPRQSER
ncbi:MAG: AAA family ATPase [Mesorhizobium sp.]